jgi:signal transduction histidine kinase
MPVRTQSTTRVEVDLGTHLANLESQLETLRAQVRQAQQLARLGTAATTIAHEVNNLLTPILSYTQAALDGGDLKLKERALTVTLKNVRVLVAMADRILQISAAKKASREAVPVRATAADAVESLCRDLAKDGITLSNQVDDSLTVWADPLALQQVLFNLFLNAREAMAPSHSGRLTITGERRDNHVVIEVRDTGEGIPPDALPHVFDPLHSSKTVRSDNGQRCKGLGLALCRDLIEENHGTIEVNSEVGTGTTFRITLPARATPAR